MGTISICDPRTAPKGGLSTPLVAVLTMGQELDRYRELLNVLDRPAGVAVVLIGPGVGAFDQNTLQLRDGTMMPIISAAEGMHVRPAHVYICDASAPLVVERDYFTRPRLSLPAPRENYMELLYETAELCNAAATPDAALSGVARCVAKHLGWRCGTRSVAERGRAAGAAHIAVGSTEMQVSLPIFCDGQLWTAIELAAPAGRIPGAAMQHALSKVVAQVEKVVERCRRHERHLQEQAERARIGRIASMGEVASSLAHELSQPLSAVVNYAAALRRLVAGTARDEAEVLQMTERLSQQVMRAGEVLQSLKQFVVRHSAERETVSIEELLHYVPKLVQDRLDGEDIAIDWAVADDLPVVETNYAYLEQILLNLLTNAVDALSRQPRERRALRLTATVVDGRPVIGIVDNGGGVAAELQARIFDAFFSTRPGGIGMGLPVSRSLAEALGGKLWLEPNGQGGASFMLSLPRGRDPGKDNNMSTGEL